jgi:hypothetical protein
LNCDFGDFTSRECVLSIRLYLTAADRSKMMSMAGCLPNTKRFRHGRPDRGRC